MKTATLESKFPLLAVENGCIISKDADITVAYRVELPELFTLTRAEYESMHSTWVKAVKVLPNYKGIHYPQGKAGQGNRHPVHGVLRTIRTHRERQWPATYHPPDG